MTKTYSNSLRTYFQDKIKSKEPTLFLTSKTHGKEKPESYSRNCQSSQKRQPVILTADEYNSITEIQPEYLKPEKHIIYGTGDTKYYYICPQYWDVRNNTPITEKEMKDNNLYQHIIDDSQKKITDTKYIYHLSDNGKINPYPNFIIKNGQCAPCCFQKNTTAKIALRKKCNQSISTNDTSNESIQDIVSISKKSSKTKSTRKMIQSSKTKIEPLEDVDVTPIVDNPSSFINNVERTEIDQYTPTEAAKASKVASKQTSEYVKNSEKFPLDPCRLGYIPMNRIRNGITITKESFTYIPSKIISPLCPARTFIYFLKEPSN